MTTPTRVRYTGYRFRPRSSATPSGYISASLSVYAWWRSCWPPAASFVSHETVRAQFGQRFANQIRRLPRVGDKWHLDEVALKIAGVKHWFCRAVVGGP